MTVRKIIELIDFIKSRIGKDSYSQSLQDYIVTIQGNNSNLVLLKEITDKSIADYRGLVEEQIPEMLNRVLIGGAEPFTSEDYLAQLETLKAQNFPDSGNQYSNLNAILTTLQANVNENIVKLEALRSTIIPFLSKDYRELQEADNAIFAIIFNNDKSFNNLKSLSFELKNWDRGLFVYQQLISEETPKAFEIVEVDQGSIEVVLNLLYTVGEHLLELFRAGFEVYGAYLTYKIIVHDSLLKTYSGNEKLLKLEDEREKLMLENVRLAIRAEIKKQSKKIKKHEAFEKKIDVVTKLVTDHIIKGNSVKLLSAPEEKEIIKEKEKEKEKVFIQNNINYKKLDPSTKQLLIDEFTTKPQEEDYDKE